MPTILFMNNFTIDVVGFVNPHKVVVQRSTWNEDVSKIRTKSATYGGLKQPFSQVENNSNLYI
jgi:hypothetical protein